MFRQFCLQHHDQLTALIAARRVQTNEVRRCCYLLPAFLLAGHLAAPRPLVLIEVGASAGLHLRFDQYAYDYGTGPAVGDPASALTLRCDLRGSGHPPLDLPFPVISSRHGIDLNPLAPASPQDAAWLRALVWADHPGRAQLLNQALAIATTGPAVTMHSGDAADQLPHLIATADPSSAVCLFHTAFLAHFPHLDRERFEHQVVVLSTARTIYWIQAEPRRDPAEPRLRLTICQDGSIAEELPLGHYQPHGAWLEWHAGTVSPPPPDIAAPQPSHDRQQPAADATGNWVRYR